ncbi:hypothetical protein ACRN9G_00170 [Shewanella frigidimarina]|uniref:hypothetical protein n=1 Tax=Shewanella frigidimarina TaxID=56812 RepID=UPI003D79E171
MKINHFNFKTVENESIFTEFSNIFLFDNLYKTAVSFEDTYKTLISDVDSALIGLLESQDIKSDFFIDIERSFFNCVNSYYQLIEHIKKSFPEKNSLPHSRLDQLISFFLENKQGYKTFTKLRNYIQHSSNVPFYLSLTNGKPAILINKSVLSEDRRINYSFGKEINSDFNFDMLNLTYDFIVEVSKVINYMFFVIAKEVMCDVKAYISYFGSENIESNKMLMARLKKGVGRDDYYPCPQASIGELKRIYNSELHKELYESIEGSISPNQNDDSFQCMKDEFIKELGKKEGTQKYNNFLKGITMPPHIIETYSNYLTFDSPEDVKKSKIEKIKKIRNSCLFDCIFALHNTSQVVKT